MLATALGLKAVHAGYRVYYTTAADLVARTTRAAIEGRWQTTMRFWNGPQVLVIDLCRYRDYAELSLAPAVNAQDLRGF
jgi:DNA replication protein DnaC